MYKARGVLKSMGASRTQILDLQKCAMHDGWVHACNIPSVSPGYGVVSAVMRDIIQKKGKHGVRVSAMHCATRLHHGVEGLALVCFEAYCFNKLCYMMCHTAMQTHFTCMHVVRVRVQIQGVLYPKAMHACIP